MAFNKQILRNSTLQVQSTLGSEITITGITNANPAVVSATNSLSDGDIVILSGIVGMEKLNGRAARVTSSSGSAFSLEGIDTTSTSVWGTYSSAGVANEISAWDTFGNVTGIDLPDGAPENLDTTTIGDESRQTELGHDASIVGTLSLFSDPADPGTAEVISAAQTRAARVFKLTTQKGTVWIWNATSVAGGQGMSAAIGNVGTGQITMTLPYAAQMFTS